MHIKYVKNRFTIPFHNSKYTINDFWLLLEQLIDSTEPLFLLLFYFERETILYFEPQKKDIRFCVIDSLELLKLKRENKFFRYLYKDMKINIDVLISKRKFIKQFYTLLFDLFNNYKDIAYFEPPLIDFDFWIKDSLKLKAYVKGRHFKP